MSIVMRLIPASIAAKRLPRAAQIITLLSIVATVPLATANLLAQQQTQDLGEASLEELANITVYTASRHIQKVTDAPSSVTVITRDEIQKYGYRTLADILRSVRGFDITYDRNFTYAGVRGINRPETYNSRVLLLIDGHRINNNLYEQAMLGTEFPLDVDLIDRVEIIRGPTSSRYGTSAFFAVISVITLKQGDVPRLQLSGTGASYGTPAGRVNFGKSFASGVSVLASASAYDSAGQRLFYPEYNDPLNNNGVSENSDDDRAYRFFSTASFKNLTVQIAFNSREKGIPTGAFDTPFNDPDARTLDTRSYLDVKYERALSAKTGLLARAYFDRYYYRGDYPYYSPYPTILLYREHSWGDWYGTQAKLTLQPGEKQALTTAVDYRDNLNQRLRSQNVHSLPLDFDDQIRSEKGGLYVQDAVAVATTLTLNLGVRRDQYETFGGNTNPRAAIIYRPVEQTTLKLLYGSAFRAPTVYELHYGSHANPNLNPEAISTYEIVLEQYTHGSLRLAGSA